MSHNIHESFSIVWHICIKMFACLAVFFSNRPKIFCFFFCFLSIKIYRYFVFALTFCSLFPFFFIQIFHTIAIILLIISTGILLIGVTVRLINDLHIFKYQVPFVVSMFVVSVSALNQSHTFWTKYSSPDPLQFPDFSF